VRILSQTDKKIPVTADIGAGLQKGLRELFFLAFAAVALFYLISLITFNLEDAGWSHTGYGRSISNGAGAVGAWLSDFSFSMIGLASFTLPFLLAALGHSIYKTENLGPFKPFSMLAGVLGLAAVIVAGASIADLQIAKPPMALPQTSGGIVGQEISERMLDAFGSKGTLVLLAFAFLVGASLYTGISWLTMIDTLGKYTLLIANGIFSVFTSSGQADPQPLEVETETVEESPAPPAPSPSKQPKTAQAEAEPTKPKPAARQKETTPVEILEKPEKATDLPEPTSAAATVAPKAPAPATPAPVAQPAPKRVKPADLPSAQPGELPPLELLNQQAAKIKGYTREALDGMARLLEGILDDFGVEVEVVGIQPGPVITRFEIQPAPGVKASRISGLAKDLARALSVTSVRVVEIIPGKSVIGLEIPNEAREIVLLHAVLDSEVYQHSDSPLTMVLGKDISGEPVVANLARMPHLLVAGTTGSGKSVAVNVMILSMLFKAGPDQVRMIMIDPKMLELSIYEGIPHLLTPVVTDMKEAANALRWSVAEMERRYKLMSMLGVRNLAGYNQKIQEAQAAGEPIFDPLWNPNMAVSEEEGPQPLEHLPFIVIVIDELADMMMIVGKKVEELIARLAQKARAAGIHLILATQRPSVDVLTGLIKANIPTRLSFQVSSRIDSRTIIDQGGAETLLGNGDMLFLPPGSGIPMRAHGAFVSDQEVHNVVEFLKRTGKPDYIEAITRFSEEGGDSGGGFKGAGGSDGGEETDALYDEAVRFVTESRKASISSVQRRFKVGYNRAARMIEDMEKAGIVGPAETNGSRAVLAPPPPEV